MNTLEKFTDYEPTNEESIDHTLAFILIRMDDLDEISDHTRFTLEQEDQLLAIEQKARELRSKLS